MDNDVLRELEVKNKEIFINKLNIDLENNNEVLQITFNNIINLFKEETINKILDMESSTLNKDNISSSVNNFYEIISTKINELMINRFNNLKNIIPIISDNYNELLSKENNNIIELIKKCYMDNIESLINNISIKYNEGEKERVSGYLKIINYEKIINKISELLNNTNLILLNNYNESLHKYNELNAKTLK